MKFICPEIQKRLVEEWLKMVTGESELFGADPSGLPGAIWPKAGGLAYRNAATVKASIANRRIGQARLSASRHANQDAIWKF
jgi:hypothetical protein